MRDVRRDFGLKSRKWAGAVTLLALFGWALPTRSVAASADTKLTTPGLVREFSASMVEVRQAVLMVQHDQIIHGTKMFDKEPILMGAEAVASTPLFDPWDGPGEVFYKIRKNAIAPRHFQDSGDQGTIAVRYVIIPVNADRTRVRVDALYMETAHRVMHASDGTVESSELKEIKGQLELNQQAAQDAADAKRRLQSAEIVRQSYLRQREDEATRLDRTQSSEKELEEEIASLRHELERRAKAPGAELKAAPFRSATTLTSLAPATPLIVLIVTSHWLGVETPDGQRGWVPVEQLEAQP